MPVNPPYPDDVESVLRALRAAVGNVVEQRSSHAVEELCGATRLQFHEMYDFWLGNDGKEVPGEARTEILDMLANVLKEIPAVKAGLSLTPHEGALFDEHVESITFRQELFNTLFNKGDLAVHEILRKKLAEHPV